MSRLEIDRVPESEADVPVHSSALSRSEATAAGMLLVTALLTFGYEMFNFNLSMDESIVAGTGHKGLIKFWIGQGRWGFAVTSLLTPGTEVPAIGTGLGVLLLFGALWVYARHIAGLSIWPSAVATAVGATLPMVALFLTFSIQAAEIGLGFALCVAARWAVGKGGRAMVFFVALPSAVLACGIYESYAAVLLVLMVEWVIRRPTINRLGCQWPSGGPRFWPGESPHPLRVVQGVRGGPPRRWRAWSMR